MPGLEGAFVVQPVVAVFVAALATGGSIALAIAVREVRRQRASLAGALEQQTATAEVLKSISRSAFHLQAVLNTVIENAVRHARADMGWMARVEGDRVVYGTALYGVDAHGHVVVGRGRMNEGIAQPMPVTSPPMEIDQRQVLGRCIIERRTISVSDLTAEPEFANSGAAHQGARSLVAAPMMREGAPIGAFLIARRHVRPFSQTDIALVEMFADQAAIALENVRLFNETKQALEQQTAVAELVEIINATGFDLQAVFDRILDLALRVCAADFGWLNVKEADASTRIAAVASKVPEFQEFARTRPIGKLIPAGAHPFPDAEVTTRALRGELVHVPDVTTDAVTYDASATVRRVEGRAVLAVPMRREEGSVGAIVLVRKEPGAFTDGQIQLMRTFADQAVIAIESARLFDQTKESLEEQTATAEVLKTINRTALDLPAVLRTVVSAAGKLCDADVGWLNQADDHVGDVPGVTPDPARFVGRWSRVGAYYGRTDELVQAAQSAFSRVKPIGGLFPMYRQTLTSLAILDRKVVNVPDWTVEPDLRASGFARAMNVRAVMAVPLMREGEAIGAIGLARLTTTPFTEREVRLAQTFADQAVIAIENVRLFNEIQDKSRQLEAASRHKSEFLANMSHELRTPLNAVIGFSDVLEQGMVGDLSDKQREYVRDIASSGKHLLDLVNEILDLSKVEAGRMELQPSEFAAADAVLSTLAFVRERASRHGIELTAEVPADLGTLVADERKVRQVLLNLLSNAVKFTPDGGWIGVSARRVDGELQVSVRDTGIGIAPEDQPKVFEEFRQVGRASDRSREGTGLGLTLAKRFVELHGGRIWFESEVGKGTTFTFALPVAVSTAEQPATA